MGLSLQEASALLGRMPVASPEPRFPAGHAPSVGSGPSSRARTIVKKLGDGYVQASPDGLNAIERQYRLELDTRPTADIHAVEDFLRYMRGMRFRWRMPGDTAERWWRCERWTGPEYVSATMRSMTLELVEDFSV